LSFWKRKKENSSSSGSGNKKARDLLLLFAGLALTLTAILLARQRIAAAEREIRRKAAPVDIVVPSVPIPAGVAFSEQNLARKSVPASGTGGRNVPAAEFELLIGAHAKGNLSAGEPILWTDVEEPFDSEKFSQTIPAGRRAFTFEANISSSFAGLIRPGDRVDLLCEWESGKAIPAWIRAIPVISVDRHFATEPTKEESREVSTLTVSVTPEEGRFLATVVRDGRIHWFLRNPDEPAKSGATYLSRTKQAAEKVEIWKAGIREISPPVPIGEPG
jgi:pilus assembly protein CpaB